MLVHTLDGFLVGRTRSTQRLWAIFLVALGLPIIAGAPPAMAASPTPVTLTAISTTFNGLIGIDYHQPSNRLAISVNYSGGEPWNFELVGADGSHSQFSSAHGFSDEVKIATVRKSACGVFTAGDLFTGNGNPGEIARITGDGAIVQSPWV